MVAQTFYGVNETTAYQTIPNGKIPPGEQAGRQRVMYDKYVLAGSALETDDVILMGRIPKGARILDCVVKSGDLGGTGTMDIGYAASADAVEAVDVDAFFNDLDLSGAAISCSMIGHAQTGVGLFKKFAAECQLTLTPAASFTQTTGVQIEVVIAYVME